VLIWNPTGRSGRRPADGKAWTYTPTVTFDQPLDIVCRRHVDHRRARRGVHPNLAQLPTLPSPRRNRGQPLHPLALRAAPKQVIMLGRRRCNGRCRRCWPIPRCAVYALTTGAGGPTLG